MDFKNWLELEEGRVTNAILAGALGSGSLAAGGIYYTNTGDRPADKPQAFAQAKELDLPDFTELDEPKKPDFKYGTDKDFIRKFWEGIKPRNKSEEVKMNNFYQFWYGTNEESLLGKITLLSRNLGTSNQEVSKKIFNQNFGKERLPKMKVAGKNPYRAGSYQDFTGTVTMHQSHEDPYEVLGHEINHARHGLGVIGNFTLEKPTEIMATTYSFLHLLEKLKQGISQEQQDTLNNFAIRFPSGVVLSVSDFIDNARNAGWMTQKGFSRYMATPQGIAFFRKLIYGQ